MSKIKMIVQLKRTFIGLGILVLILSACQSNVAFDPVSPTTTDNGAAETLTALVLTLTAQAFVLPSATPPDSTDVPETVVTVLQATALPTDIPTITVTPSPVIPLVSVSAPTNCRTGPGELYEVIRVVEPGAKYEVIGKYIPQNTWIINVSEKRACWLWGKFATVEGNINSIPEYNPPIGSVEGVVRDAVSKDGIPGVTVTIQPAGFKGPLPKDFQKSTNKKGKYSFANVPIGEIIITFSYNSNIFDTATAIVRNGQMFVADIDVEPVVLEGK